MSVISHRAEKVVRGIAGGTAIRLPPKIGPKRWTSFAIRTRTRQAADVVDTDPARALRLVTPALLAAAPARTTMIAAMAHEKLGNTAEAIEHAQAATAKRPRDFWALREHRKMAARTGHAEEVQRVLTAIAATRPRSRSDLATAVAELRAAPMGVIEKFAKTARSHEQSRRLDLEPMDELLDENALVKAHKSGPEAFSEAKARVLVTRTHPIAVVSRALVRRRAWQEAADFVVVTPGSQLIGSQASGSFPVRDITHAAKRALQAGYPAAASMLAARALAADKSARSAQETFNSAHEQVRASRNGLDRRAQLSP